ncbi:hypothetical protein OOZ15_16190 [Galbibacter sp. EGI 63066]|uniref:hypothetical protein n=1 Tax=Galbibacter sp. EGI 63066 TaxID=2993559 RepID=UPI0022489335|nr:hypothetical protein [Galbibacter sp. EGI 63066]MCX2681494.1 hypothetical protein [Galbibacter sp. EGI 63066]
MKRLYSNLLKISGLLLFVLLLNSCNNEPNTIRFDPVDISKKKLNPEKASKLSKHFVKDIEELFAKADSLEYYKQMIAKMREGNNMTKQEPQKFTRKSPKFNLSISSWYSTDELLSYIKRSKDSVKAMGGEVDGFRIYIGVFPENDERKPNTLATFITPTGFIPDSTQKAEGSILPNFVKPYYAVSPDITEVDAMEYGTTGEPPKATYPQQ